jgi:alkylation response protein AidB-like acyl-CoA dehydrogenase
MYPQLEEVHNLVRKTAKDFVERRVEPNARRIDQGWYPRELLREMGSWVFWLLTSRLNTAARGLTSGVW